MKALVLDADKSARGALVDGLNAANIVTECATDGNDAFDFLRSLDFDALIISGALPDTSVVKFVRDVRADKQTIPILVIGEDDLSTLIETLDAGADDYMRTPIFSDELAMRVRVLVRRFCGVHSSVITCGALTLDLTQHLAFANGVRVHLTGKEFAILELLMLRKNTVLTKDAFLSHLYNDRDEPELKIIDVFMCKLRKKLGAACGGEIETVWGRGYVLRDPETPLIAAPSLAPELRDMMDDPPVAVSKMSPQEYDAMRARKAAKAGKRIASPPLAPV